MVPAQQTKAARLIAAHNKHIQLQFRQHYDSPHARPWAVTKACETFPFSQMSCSHLDIGEPNDQENILRILHPCTDFRHFNWQHGACASGLPLFYG